MYLEDLPWSEAEFTLNLGAITVGWFSFVAVGFGTLGIALVVVVIVVLSILVGLLLVGSLIDFHWCFEYFKLSLVLCHSVLLVSPGGLIEAFL